MTPSALSLTTPRLRLSTPGPEMASRVVDYFVTNRTHLKRWEPPFPKSMFTNAFWEQRLKENQKEYREGRSIRLILTRAEDPEGPMIGSVNFTQIVRGALMGCGLGYSIDEDVQGQGLMTEALSAAIEYVFDELKLHRIMASYIPTNERSGKLLRRLNFQVEGYARDYLFIDGAWQDHVLAALQTTHDVIPSDAKPGASTT
ncbi:MAG: GNAT family N-acetyltransferase [Polyangiaceae bacterium]